MPTPRVTDDVRLLPAKRVENAARVSDVRAHCERSFRRRRREPTLLIPRDVVLLRKLVGEIPQVVETEPRPSVQKKNRRSAAGAASPDDRSGALLHERAPRHETRASHARIRVVERSLGRPNRPKPRPPRLPRKRDSYR